MEKWRFTDPVWVDGDLEVSLFLLLFQYLIVRIWRIRSIDY